MSNNLSNSNTIMAGIKEVGHKVFGGYAELLRIPHTARYSIGSVIACMPFPMVGMTITISVQHYYGNYSLAGMLTAIQAIALAVATPLRAAGMDTRNTVSKWVAPRARDACSYSSGTARREVSDTLMMEGRIMMASTRMAASRQAPEERSKAR